MPNVQPGESKDDFLKRCIPMLRNEGKPEDQAIAICESMYEEKKMSAYERTCKKLNIKPYVR